MAEVGRGYVMLSEAGKGWVRLVRIVSIEVGCCLIKWVKVYHMGSGQVVNKDG